jgi:organic radical activating enzyme
MTRLKLPVAIEIPVIFTCNLTCRQCAHLSPYFPKETPPVSVQELEEMCAAWSPRITARHVNITGGEPLVHPDIEKIFCLFRRYWNHAEQIEVTTNGLVLEQMPDSFFATMAEYKIHCKVTLHHEKFRERIEQSVQRIIGSPDHCGYWIHDYAKDGDHVERYQVINNAPVFPRSDSRKAYHTCYCKEICSTLFKNRL